MAMEDAIPAVRGQHLTANTGGTVKAFARDGFYEPTPELTKPSDGNSWVQIGSDQFPCGRAHTTLRISTITRFSTERTELNRSAFPCTHHNTESIGPHGTKTDRDQGSAESLQPPRPSELPSAITPSQSALSNYSHRITTCESVLYKPSVYISFLQ